MRRDRGGMAGGHPVWGTGIGGLVLVLVEGRISHQDRHKAPTLSITPPLSLHTKRDFRSFPKRPTRASTPGYPLRVSWGGDEDGKFDLK